jgi:hypothetical protein
VHAFVCTPPWWALSPALHTRAAASCYDLLHALTHHSRLSNPQARASWFGWLLPSQNAGDSAGGHRRRRRRPSHVTWGCGGAHTCHTRRGRSLRAHAAGPSGGSRCCKPHATAQESNQGPGRSPRAAHALPRAQRRCRSHGGRHAAAGDGGGGGAELLAADVVADG